MTACRNATPPISPADDRVAEKDFHVLISPVLGGRQHVRERDRLSSYVEVPTLDNTITVRILMMLQKWGHMT